MPNAQEISNTNPDGTSKGYLEQKILNEKGEWITNKYDLGPLIGKGGFARVYLIKD